jgi:hypothetical protein
MSSNRRETPEFLPAERRPRNGREWPWWVHATERVDRQADRKRFLEMGLRWRQGPQEQKFFGSRAGRLFFKKEPLAFLYLPQTTTQKTIITNRTVGTSLAIR